MFDKMSLKEGTKLVNFCLWRLFFQKPVKTIGLHEVENNLVSIMISCSVGMDVFFC